MENTTFVAKSSMGGIIAHLILLRLFWDENEAVFDRSSQSIEDNDPTCGANS
jgi:hypothetical protein